MGKSNHSAIHRSINQAQALMYTLTDVYNNLLFTFEDKGSIRDRAGKALGFVKGGVVCDPDGTPTRVTVQGNTLVWNGVNPGPVIELYGVVVYDIGDQIPAGIVVGPANPAQCLIAGAAYWEFVLSRT